MAQGIGKEDRDSIRIKNDDNSSPNEKSYGASCVCYMNVRNVWEFTIIVSYSIYIIVYNGIGFIQYNILSMRIILSMNVSISIVT